MIFASDGHIAAGTIANPIPRNTMRITIHRGTDQIGGCVTEYEYDGWKLFVDYGEQLPGASKSEVPLEVEGLTKGDLSKSALIPS